MHSTNHRPLIYPREVLLILGVLAMLFIPASPKALSDAVSATQQPAPALPPSIKNLNGTWSGEIVIAPAFLLLVVHFIKNSDGTVTETFDTPEQSAYGVLGAPVTDDHGTISVPAPTIGGIFQGTMSSDGKAMYGFWKQNGRSMPLTLTKVEKSAAPLPTCLNGAYSGSLQYGHQLLRLVVHFYPEPNGAVLAGFDSPDQNATGIPGGAVTEKAGSIFIPVSTIDASYTGRLAADGATLIGHWTQNGLTLPLTLKPTDGAAEQPVRPQTPRPPFPYAATDVHFPSTALGVELAGTLTMPHSGLPVPGIVLVAGSGPNDRNEEAFKHQPFAVIADYLTRRGFVVLRYDKRGVGGSTGSYEDATIDDFANDAQSAVSFLKTVPGVDPQRIGMIGHSEGGEIAPLVASRDVDVKFVVLLAGPALPNIRVLLRQYVLIAEGEGMTPEQVQKEMTFQRPADALLASSKAGDDSMTKLIALYERTHPENISPAHEQIVQQELAQLDTPWVRSFLNFDPRPALEKLTIPVLALNGSRDRQVDSEQNLPAMREALAKSKSKNIVVKKMPGLNHMFQDCATGSIAEYSAIEETFSPAALQTMGDWLTSVTCKSAAAR